MVYNCSIFNSSHTRSAIHLWHLHKSIQTRLLLVDFAWMVFSAILVEKRIKKGHWFFLPKRIFFILDKEKDHNSHCSQTLLPKYQQSAMVQRWSIYVAHIWWLSFRTKIQDSVSRHMLNINGYHPTTPNSTHHTNLKDLTWWKTYLTAWLNKTLTCQQ